MPNSTRTEPGYTFDGYRAQRGRPLRGPDRSEIDLPKRAVGVLVRLLEEPGRTIERDELIAAAWPDTHVSDDALVQAVGALRRALGDDARRPRYVETVHGRGYRFIAPVMRSDEASTARPDGATVATAPARSRARPRPSDLGTPALRAAGVVLAVLAIGAAARTVTSSAVPVDDPAIEFAVQPEDGRIPVRGTGSLALSPDGRDLVFSVQTDESSHLAHRPLGSVRSRAIPGTERAEAPFFSPDGARIGFFVGNEIRSVGLDDEPAVTLGSVAMPAGAAWSADGRIFVGSDSGLWVLGEAGAPPVRITETRHETGEQGHHWPHVTADGATLLFTVWEGSPARSRVDALDLATGERRPLVLGAGGARADVPGQVTFVRGGTLLAAALAPDRLAIEGSPRALATDVFTHPYQGTTHYGLSRDGTLAYLTGATTVAPAGHLEWADGEAFTALLPGPVKGMALAPDGARLAAVIEEGEGYRTWIVERGADRARPLAPYAPRSTGTTWSPDGRWLAIAITRPDHDLVVIDPGDGRVLHELLLPGDQFPTAWIAGEGVVYEEWDDESGWDLWLWPLDDSAPVPIARSEADEWRARAAADGRLAYLHTDAAGAPSIRVRPSVRSTVTDEITIAGLVDDVAWDQDGALLALAEGRIARVVLDTPASSGVQRLPLLQRADVVHLSSSARGLLLYVAAPGPGHELHVVVTGTELSTRRRAHGL